MAEDKLRTMRELVDKLNFAANAYYNGQGRTDVRLRMGMPLFDEVKRFGKRDWAAIPRLTNQPSFGRQYYWKEGRTRISCPLIAKTKQPIELAKWAEERPILAELEA